MFQYLRKVTRSTKDRGATAVEYALMVAAIAAVIVGVVFGLGRIVLGAFNNTCTAISSSANISDPSASCPG
jgi:pilus assembly protein Flp/PilA